MNKSSLCRRCGERVAIIYLTKYENGKPVHEGYCLKCAKEMNLPHVNDVLERFGISDEDIDHFSNQLNEAMNGEEGFFPGGAQAFPGFLDGLFQQDGSENLPAEVEEYEEEEEAPAQKENGKKGKKKKLRFLPNYCENLTQKAREGRIDNIVGRDRELERVMQILNRRQKNNPCLIGEPGVGKTAVAEGVAQRLAEDNVPPRLRGKELYLLDLTALVAGTQFRGQFESRVKGLVEEVKREGNIILFIDEVHSLVGTGSAEGSMNAANILKPALSRGEIQVIGATTFEEYRKYIEKDAALERRFQPVSVPEPTIEESVEVLRGVKKYYEEFHRVKVSEDIVRRCVAMSERYITDRRLPDKAIDLLDEACSCAALANHELDRYDRLNRRMKNLTEQLEEMETRAEPPYEEIASARSEIARLSVEVKALEGEALSRPVTVDDLAHVVELWTGIPASRIKESELQKVADLANALKKHIIGQDEAVEVVAAAVRRSRVRLSEKPRPASFLFVGPTGVGKTELVRRLAEEMFDSTEPLIRVDMSEFMEKHAVSRLVGSPPGYVGYDEAGQLTEKVRRKPYSVVLFDEIEKAHPDVLNILLQILDEGFVTDAQGRKVSFANTVIVMTSNAGSAQRTNAMGFDKSQDVMARDKAEKALREFLRPEFIARIDEIVVFRHLDEGDYAKIAALLLGELKAPLLDRDIRFNWTDEAAQLIAHEAFGSKSGARDLRRVIRRKVEDVITTMLLEHVDDPPTLISAVVENGDIVLKTDKNS